MKTGWVTWRGVLAAVGVELLLLTPARAQDVARSAPAAGAAASAAYKLPLVVLRQQAIEGRVFFIAEEQESDAYASGVDVQVRLQGAEQPAVQTRTDEIGRFGLPDLAVGVYRLTIGRLTVELRVMDPAAVEATEAAKIPKMIAIFIPRALVDAGAAKPAEPPAAAAP